MSSNEYQNMPRTLDDARLFQPLAFDHGLVEFQQFPFNETLAEELIGMPRQLIYVPRRAMLTFR